MNEAIFEVELGGLERGLGGFHLCLVYVDRIFLRIVVLFRNGLRSHETLIPSKLDFGEFKCGFRLGEICLSRIKLGLKGARIDYEQKLALLEICAIFEVSFGDAPAQLGRHRHGLEGAVLADLIEVNGNVARNGGRNCNRRRRLLECCGHLFSTTNR